MDDKVLRAMERWPEVPAAYGWLRLDRRGQWFLVDRNKPGFDEVEDGRGSVLRNDNLIDFIARNYACDSNGCWYWQNGPQRAYADLDTAPIIARVMNGPGGQLLVTHTGVAIRQVSRACIGPEGVLYLVTELGPASIHDLDLASLDITDSDVLIHNRRLAMELLTEPVDETLGFVRKPRP